MKEFIGNRIGIILVSFMLIFLCTEVSLALDNLSLSGFVQSIDKNNGLITLNVTSESCKGLRSFRVSNNAKDDLDETLVGVNLQFGIDSSECERGKIYNMILKEKP
jgi:hypothetical protein